MFYMPEGLALDAYFLSVTIFFIAAQPVGVTGEMT